MFNYIIIKLFVVIFTSAFQDIADYYTNIFPYSVTCH